MEITSGQPAINVGGNGGFGFGGDAGIMFLAFLAMMGGPLPPPNAFGM